MSETICHSTADGYNVKLIDRQYYVMYQGSMRHVTLTLDQAIKYIAEDRDYRTKKAQIMAAQAAMAKMSPEELATHKFNQKLQENPDYGNW